MKRIILAATIVLACISAWGQERQDSLESVNKLLELQEVVVKGNLPDLYLDVEGPKGVYRVYYDKPQYTLNAYVTTRFSRTTVSLPTN